MDQRGRMIEATIAPMLGLVLLAVGLPHLLQGRWIAGLLFVLPGALLLLLVPALWLKGWWEERQAQKGPGTAG
jgi:hypothetical protein